MNFTALRLEQLEVGQRIAESQGFQAEKLKDDRVAFRLQKRIKGTGKTPTYFLLGYYPDTSIKEAREKAGEYRKKCDAGEDPRKAIEEALVARQAEEKLKTITLQDAFNREFLERNRLRKKPRKESTVANYRHIINGVSRDWWDKPVRSITEDMVEERYFSYRAQTGCDRQAQQWVNICRSLFKLICRWKINGQAVVTGNPFNVIDTPTQAEGRKGRLFPEEVDHVFKSYWHQTDTLLQDRNYPFAYPLGEEAQHYALCLLAYTGLRLREVLSIRWNDCFPKGSPLRGEYVEEPLLRVYVKKTGETASRIHFIPVTKTVAGLLNKQKLVQNLFLESKSEKIRAEWKSDYVFFSHSKKNTPMDGLDKAIARWRQWIGEPRIWIQLEEETRNENGNVRDKNERFSAHWLRHTFSTVAKELGYTEQEVAVAVGKKVKGETSQQGYMHDDVVEQAENSRPMFLKVQEYLSDEEYQSRWVRKIARANPDMTLQEIVYPDPPDGIWDNDGSDEFEVVPGGYVAKGDMLKKVR